MSSFILTPRELGAVQLAAEEAKRRGWRPETPIRVLVTLWAASNRRAVANLYAESDWGNGPYRNGIEWAEHAAAEYHDQGPQTDNPIHPWSTIEVDDPNYHERALACLRYNSAEDPEREVDPRPAWAIELDAAIVALGGEG